jgi:hypothetical protein
MIHLPVDIGLIADAAILIALLIAMTVMGRVLKRLKTTKRSANEMRALMQEFTDRVERSRVSLDELEASARQTGSALKADLDTAERMHQDLVFALKAGEGVARRLESARANGRFAGGGSEAAPDSTIPASVPGPATRDDAQTMRAAQWGQGQQGGRGPQAMPPRGADQPAGRTQTNAQVGAFGRQAGITSARPNAQPAMAAPANQDAQPAVPSAAAMNRAAPAQDTAQQGFVGGMPAAPQAQEGGGQDIATGSASAQGVGGGVAGQLWKPSTAAPDNAAVLSSQTSGSGGREGEDDAGAEAPKGAALRQFLEDMRARRSA